MRHVALATGVFLVAVAFAPAPGPGAQTSVRLAVIANPAVPVKSLSTSELASIFTRATRTWKDGSAIRAINLQPSSPERVAFDRAVLHMEPEQSAQYWVDRMVRGEEAAPKAIAKADIVLRLVPTLAGSIGYVPEDKVDDKMKVLAFIRDGRVVSP
jgi:ABC-type phosphate transport system substrate-binding protein